MYCGSGCTAIDFRAIPIGSTDRREKTLRTAGPLDVIDICFPVSQYEGPKWRRSRYRGIDKGESLVDRHVFPVETLCDSVLLLGFVREQSSVKSITNPILLL